MHTGPAPRVPASQCHPSRARRRRQRAMRPPWGWVGSRPDHIHPAPRCGHELAHLVCHEMTQADRLPRETSRAAELPPFSVRTLANGTSRCVATQGPGLLADGPYHRAHALLATCAVAAVQRVALVVGPSTRLGLVRNSASYLPSRPPDMFPQTSGGLNGTYLTSRCRLTSPA